MLLPRRVDLIAVGLGPIEVTFFHQEDSLQQFGGDLINSLLRGRYQGVVSAHFSKLLGPFHGNICGILQPIFVELDLTTIGAPSGMMMR